MSGFSQTIAFSRLSGSIPVSSARERLVGSGPPSL